uniref:Laccase 5 n=1 Tax=Amylostereum areolatum TaxID=103385 RepID=A0A873P8S5_9AGAM|nr:laccase 5 [Amylostereum areolatum]
MAFKTLTSSLFLLASVSTGALAAIGPVTDLHITNEVLSPDGFSRETVVAGGTVPGPLITGNIGDRFQINVFDDLSDTELDTATSIHWHGLFQHSTQHADGVSFVTQCPIIPNNSFLYDFQVPGQAGTFWYHSHYRNQYCDGLRGALVIYDPNDPHASLYDVDDDSTVITLADWYHYLSTEPPANGVPSPNSTLINGLGRFPEGPSDSPLAIVNVTAGQRYRFRLVSISCDDNFVFSIDGHTLTVIEVDGVSHEPLVVDNIQIFAAQRYSFVLNANQPVDNYWIRALPDTNGASYDGGLNSAILRYSGAAVADPTSNSSLSLPLVETNLHPLTNPAAPGDPTPGGADVNLNLAVTFNGAQFEVNGVPFEPPSVPVLLQVLNGAPAAQLLPNGSIYSLPANKTVEVVIPGGVINVQHPVHLHGHTFSVVRSAGNSSYNFVNPVQRDVVNIGLTGDEVTIRFETNNPGPWFLHCHIDWHLNTGFAVVFAEDVPDIPSVDSPIPPAWNQLCPAYDSYINSTGNT